MPSKDARAQDRRRERSGGGGSCARPAGGGCWSAGGGGGEGGGEGGGGPGAPPPPALSPAPPRLTRPDAPEPAGAAAARPARRTPPRGSVATPSHRGHAPFCRALHRPGSRAPPRVGGAHSASCQSFPTSTPLCTGRAPGDPQHPRSCPLHTRKSQTERNPVRRLIRTTHTGGLSGLPPPHALRVTPTRRHAHKPYPSLGCPTSLPSTRHASSGSALHLLLDAPTTLCWVRRRRESSPRQLVPPPHTQALGRAPVREGEGTAGIRTWPGWGCGSPRPRPRATCATLPPLPRPGAWQEPGSADSPFLGSPMPCMSWGQNIPAVGLWNVRCPTPHLAERICRVRFCARRFGNNRNGKNEWGCSKKVCLGHPLEARDTGVPAVPFLPRLGTLETGAEKLRLANGAIANSRG